MDTNDPHGETNSLSTVPFEVFAAKAEIVPVMGRYRISASGVRGDFHHHTHSTTAAPDADAALRRFALRCAMAYAHRAHETLTQQELDKLVDETADKLLNPDIIPADPLSYCLGPDGHTLVLYQGMKGPFCNATREKVLRHVWLTEQQPSDHPLH
jgi:hypothetical protein